MDDIIKLVKLLSEASPKQRRDSLKELANNSGVSKLFIAMKGDDKRPIVRALSDLSAFPATREIIARNMLINKEDVLLLIKSEDAKLRKTTAELIGRTVPEGFSIELCDMLLSEQTAFVRPSIILAMGNATAHERVKSTLQNYKIPQSESVHMKAEQVALSKAMSNMAVVTDSEMSQLPEGTSLILECANARITLAELKSLGFDASLVKHPDNCVYVRGVKNYEDIFRARTFYSAHIYVGKFEKLDECAKAITSNKFAKLCTGIFGDNPLFRVEMCEQGTFALSHAMRKITAEKIATHVKKPLVNSPSKYLFQLKIVCTVFGIFLMISPPTKLDNRFKYRGISASVHPAAAASILYATKEYHLEQNDVVDPFCGAGTLILERSKYPFKSLAGMDISMEALKTAKRNERDVRCGIELYLKSATTEYELTYDEVICNMPFGNRVSSHKKNEYLYQEFMGNLDKMLKREGVAMIFTQEKKLLQSNLGDFELIGKINFSCGGLFPALFIIKRSEISKENFDLREQQKEEERRIALMAAQTSDLPSDDDLLAESITDEEILEQALSSQEASLEIEEESPVADDFQADEEISPDSEGEIADATPSDA